MTLLSPAGLKVSLTVWQGRLPCTATEVATGSRARLVIGQAVETFLVLRDTC